jgi:hypothetical protein
MGLHGLVFVIIGAIVLIISFFKTELLFFRYVGGLFLIYGTFKLVFRLITGANSKKEALDIHSEYRQGLTPEQTQQQNAYNNQRNQNQQYQRQHQQTNFNQPAQRRIMRCRCGNVIPITSNFCNNCGSKLK